MSPFVRPRPLNHPKRRLVAFHHAGGSAATYYPLVRAAPDDWDVMLLDLPGRGKRYSEAPLSSFSEVVRLVVRDLLPFADAPLCLFGHSYGAIVASEVARALEARQLAPLWLGVSGRIAPSERRSSRLLHELDDRTLLQELLALGGTPERIREVPDFQQRFLDVARVDLAAVESYAPLSERNLLHCPISAYAGALDPWAPPVSMLGWRRETTVNFEQRIFPGGHFYFLESAFARFAQTLVQDIVDGCDAPASRGVLPLAHELNSRRATEGVLMA